MTQKVFELGSSNFLAFLTNAHHLRLKAGLLYLLPESSGILPKCLILLIAKKFCTASPLKGICTFSVFFNTHSGIANVRTFFA